jgi:DNA-binding protein HU-beta
MNNPMQTGDGVGLVAKAFTGLASALKGGKKSSRKDSFSEGTTHGDMYKAAAAAQRMANKHEKEMHALQHESLVSTAQKLGYDSSSSASVKTPSGGEVSFGASTRKTAPRAKSTPRAKAAPKKALTTKQAAVSVPPVKKATAKPAAKKTMAPAIPATSIKARKVK